MIVGEFRVCNPRRSHIDWLCLRLVTIRKTGRQAGHKRAFTYIHECIYNTTLRSNDPSGNQLISHSADSAKVPVRSAGQPVGTEVSCRLLYLAVQYFRCSICAVRRIRVALPPVGCGTYSVVIHRGRSMRVERVPYRLITVATAAVFLAACGKESAPPPQTPEVGVVTVNRKPYRSSANCRAAPAFLVAQVRARVDGIVLRREFTEGTDVKAGQRLYKIDPAPYVAALNSAKATLAKAQANLVTQNALVARYKVLVAANAVSKQDYDNAVATQSRGGRRGRQGGGRYRADQPRLYRRRIADHRSRRHLASDAGRVRAGEPGDADVDGAAARSGVRRPHAVEPRRPEAAAGTCRAAA